MAKNSAPNVWQRAERGARGPQPAHSRQRIAATAIRLADADGLRAASMRAIAQEMGTAVASLYRYVASRDQLLDLIMDATAAELDLTHATGPWRETLVAVALQVKAVYERHEWRIDLAERTSTLGPNALAYTEYCLRTIADVPVSGTTKMEVLAMIDGIACLFARQKRAAVEYGLPPETISSFPHLASVATEVAREMESSSTDATNELFSRVITGALEALLEPGHDQSSDDDPGSWRPVD